MAKRTIQTGAAPAALGTYSQAVITPHAVYLSGQIGLDPSTMELAEGVHAQAQQVFANLDAVARAAGGSLDDIVKLTIYLTDLGAFADVNNVMEALFTEPYPARATVEVSALPKGALVEVEGILCPPA